MSIACQCAVKNDKEMKTNEYEKRIERATKKKTIDQKWTKQQFCESLC